MHRPVVLLGPQRHEPTVVDVVRELAPNDPRPVACVTAGWEEREPEDVELTDHLQRPVVNLRTWQRGEDVFAQDPELHSALLDRHVQLEQLRSIYRLRLRHASPVARQLLQRAGDDRWIDAEREATFEAVRRIDAEFLGRMTAFDAEFAERLRLFERDAVGRHREELRGLLTDASCICIAGGHVGVLLSRMRLFGMNDLLASSAAPIVGWSAGAMVLTDRIVLFHDSPPQGPSHAEVWDRGFSFAPSVVALPHARHRLRLDDSVRVSALARRFAPATCVALDDGARVDVAAGGTRLHASARRLTTTGELAEDAA